VPVFAVVNIYMYSLFLAPITVVRVQCSSVSVILSVCPQHNSETNNPKVFKLGVGNEPFSSVRYPTSDMVLGQKVSVTGHRVQRHIAGVSLHLYQAVLDSRTYGSRTVRLSLFLLNEHDDYDEELEVQGQGLVNWSSRTRTFLKDNNTGLQ